MFTKQLPACPSFELKEQIIETVIEICLQYASLIETELKISATEPNIERVCSQISELERKLNLYERNGFISNTEDKCRKQRRALELLKKRFKKNPTPELYKRSLCTIGNLIYDSIFPLKV